MVAGRRLRWLLRLLDPTEMANTGTDDLAARLRRLPYAHQFEMVFAAGVLDSSQALVVRAAEALERFEIEDPLFHPDSSRYDRFLAGAATLDAQELNGLRLFIDPAKGNCTACRPHTSGPGDGGLAFTDFGFHALGVPRNPAIPANRDSRHFDLGLCGLRRADLAHETRYCGFFRTPTLRNVTRRQHFFHNGRFSTLREVLEFYAGRDLQSSRWYPRRRGKLRKLDDLLAFLATLEDAD